MSLGMERISISIFCWKSRTSSQRIAGIPLGEINMQKEIRVVVKGSYAITIWSRRNAWGHDGVAAF